MKRPLIGTKTTVMYAAAAIVGFALGSYQYLAPLSGDKVDDEASRSKTVSPAPSQSPEVSVVPTDVQAPNGGSRHPEPMPKSSIESDGLVFADAGLVLRPAQSDGRFIGFLVVRNDSDRRFAVGDVIVSVNGQPVENSAAGSELLIAALANPDVPVEVHAGEIE